MRITHYTISGKGLDENQLLKAWQWRIGEDKKICLILKSGDLILADRQEKIHLLDTGGGELSTIANSYSEFENKISKEEVFAEVFLSPLIDELEASGKILQKNQIYSYLKLPILGGAYDKENMYCLNIFEHFNLTGEVNYQLKDLPDGTRIKIRTKGKTQ